MQHPTGNTAILVIHGIGEQNPYETLDSFAQGLARHFSSQGARPLLRPERIRHESWTEIAIHLEFAESATANGLRRLSLFEFYWAPYTEGKVTDRQVLTWLIRTALSPLRYLSNNLQMLLEARKEGLRSVAGLFLREIVRAAFLYVPLALVLAVVAVLLTLGLPSLSPAYQELAELWKKETHVLALGGITVCWLMAVLLLASIVRELGHWQPRRTTSIQRTAEKSWLAMAAVSAVVFFLAGLWIATTWDVDAWAYLGALTDPRMMGILGAAGLLWFLRRVLVGYVGDVVVYVTADAKSSNYKARSAILQSSTQAVSRLLLDEERRFDQVILAGHSLGSVIAYDTLNRLLSQVWASAEATEPGAATTLTRAHLQKVKGLVTFGSPLDKVYYFFREQVQADQAVRAQILSFLHSFRKQRSGRTYGELTFTYSPPDAPGSGASAFTRLGEDFRWLNVWAPMDPASGKLDFYQVDQQRWRPYIIWGLAHLSYWKDPQFYSFVASEFL
ncbi:MAG: hypothetical protein ACRD35_00495 [Candidatus Acidiferrales bacterium]